MSYQKNKRAPTGMTEKALECRFGIYPEDKQNRCYALGENGACSGSGDCAAFQMIVGAIRKNSPKSVLGLTKALTPDQQDRIGYENVPVYLDLLMRNGVVGEKSDGTLAVSNSIKEPKKDYRKKKV